VFCTQKFTQLRPHIDCAAGACVSQVQSEQCVCVYWCSQNRTKSAEDIIKLDKAVVLESMAVHQHNRNVGYEVQEEEHVTVLQRWRALTRGCCRGGRRRAVVPPGGL